MPAVSLVLPLPVSTNRLHVGSGKSRRRTEDYSAWRDAAGWEIVQARPRLTVKALPARCWWRSRLRWPVNDAADSDNRIKALHDLLVSMGVTPDDRWLHGGSYGRSALCPPGKCLVRVWSLQGVAR